MNTGVCHLVGAGPGDPGLLTLKGRACLEGADVVVYDALCNPELLAWAPENAERIFAGKRAGAHTLTQPEINALIVARVREGRTVVRLKGGDPFVFGRGGEEAEALAAAGCRFEIIPGVTSAIAGPAYAGIPVTHRAHSSAVTVFTAHEDPAKPDGALDYQLIARTPGTKVMLMGVERLGPVAEALIAGGLPPDEPVALVQRATTGAQRTLTGTLQDIAGKAAETGFEAPALAVIGSVVGMRKKLNWFESLPLFGRTVAVTRTRKQAGELVGRLRQLGADAFEVPTIRIEPAPNKREFYELVVDSHIYDWIIFTSPNGVHAFFKAFYEIFRDARDIGGARIAAIGPATAQAVRAYHLQVDIQPAKFVAEAIIEALVEQGSVENLKFLLPRAEGAREVLVDELSKRGAIVDEAIAYRTVPETGDPGGGIERFRETGADLVTFTSSSTAENFMALKLGLPRGLKTASIGPITSATMRSLGLPVDIEATQHDIPGLVSAIVSALTG